MKISLVQCITVLRNLICNRSDSYTTPGCRIQDFCLAEDEGYNTEKFHVEHALREFWNMPTPE